MQKKTQSWKSDNYIGSNREKSNIYSCNIRKNCNLIVNQNLFCILGAPILFKPAVTGYGFAIEILML